MVNNGTAVHILNVTKTFVTGQARVQALRGVNLNVRVGELLMLVGPSGCGKTTLISVVAGILNHDEGECLVFGVPSGDPDRAESIAGCIVLKSPASPAELKDFLLHHLPAWQIPRQWLFVESLGVNQRGKISRAEWRKKFLERSVKAQTC